MSLFLTIPCLTVYYFILGMYFAIPFIDEIHRVDMREMTLEVHPATGITQDNVSVKTGGALYVQV